MLKAQGICLMTGRGHTMPCSAAGCPLFGDCLVRYEKEQREKATPKPMSNEEWLKSLHKGDLANTIHAFHLGYSPWCDHHCENEGDDGCDNCIVKWLELPVSDEGEPSVVPQVEDNKEITTRKHLSQVKRGETILYRDRHYVTCHDAEQDLSHPGKEWWVEAFCKEDKLYETFYESTFLDGIAVIVVGELEVE